MGAGHGLPAGDGVARVDSHRHDPEQTCWQQQLQLQLCSSVVRTSALGESRPFLLKTGGLQISRKVSLPTDQGKYLSLRQVKA